MNLLLSFQLLVFASALGALGAKVADCVTTARFLDATSELNPVASRLMHRFGVWEVCWAFWWVYAAYVVGMSATVALLAGPVLQLAWCGWLAFESAVHLEAAHINSGNPPRALGRFLFRAMFAFRGLIARFTS